MPRWLNIPGCYSCHSVDERSMMLMTGALFHPKFPIFEEKQMFKALDMNFTSFPLKPLVGVKMFLDSKLWADISIVN